MNKIPQFLAHLSVWKVNPEDKARYKAERVKEHKYDVLEPRNKKQNANSTVKEIPKKELKMVEKICPMCGKTFSLPYKYRDNRITCSYSCGAKYTHMKNNGGEWVAKAKELRKQGMKLQAIANVVGMSVSTVWEKVK